MCINFFIPIQKVEGWGVALSYGSVPLKFEAMVSWL